MPPILTSRRSRGLRLHLRTERYPPTVALTGTALHCYNRTNNCNVNDCEQNEYLPKRGDREPGVVEPGAGAGSEWIWESGAQRAARPQ